MSDHGACECASALVCGEHRALAQALRRNDLRPEAQSREATRLPTGARDCKMRKRPMASKSQELTVGLGREMASHGAVMPSTE